ncbi:glycine zipper family protein [Ruegeria sp. Ofav3-42]|uniref:glycine zipper family protein n=1 Tax=Ruegeria sp. Ofav3-42 TaxID=2917759 RepID=UPI001EF72E35|nr:glycine zipper family protein [Ruegeria sp. Ofav3-42]MCG7522598.1 glycine zipper family protein [Ruegeria sp. Ofav3-42]
MKKFLCIALLGLSACTQYPMQKPLAVDGTRNANFLSDETECRALAANYHSGKREMETAFGAIDGALTGAAIGDGYDALGGAVAGGIFGSVKGQYEDDLIRRQALINCMQGRGHQVYG